MGDRLRKLILMMQKLKKTEMITFQENLTTYKK